ncbi:acyl-CoA dehydrogenase family protein [Halomonas mongoliensis]|uniref:acyl-CoA dehydrogenase family protein n=1 Tax=Halomonas mongoliensis TaxID=321265 RepID=UPI00403AC4AE
MRTDRVNTIDYNAMSDDDFRRMVRDWISANYPAEIRNPPRRLGIEPTRPWYESLSQQGWLTPGWPQEFGGMGLTAGKQLIMMEEMENYGCARLPDSGITMLGPLLIRYGTDEQKARFLPAIQSGEHIWCQGYSEPNAGSDLAGLRTEAVLDGDHWVVNGQKIWTTMATEANWIFVLVRTDRETKPQAGISFLLVDMNTSGVEVRPIENLERHAEFCEVFFSDVRVPKENLVGEVNQGWGMAKALLGFERIFLGSPKQSTNALVRLERLARHVGIWNDPVFQDRYVTLAMDLECHTALYESFADQLKQGKALGPDVSMLKVFQSELYQRISELAISVAGERSGTLEPFTENGDLHPAGLFIQSRPTTIYGGTNEVQRNILAKHVLGLGG